MVGVGFYLFTKAGIGTKYLGARLEKLRVETEPYMQQNEYVVHAMKGGRVANANLSHFLYNQVGFPTYGNSQAQYFPLGDDKFPVLIEELFPGLQQLRGRQIGLDITVIVKCHQDRHFIDLSHARCLQNI